MGPDYFACVWLDVALWFFHCDTDVAKTEAKLALHLFAFVQFSCEYLDCLPSCNGLVYRTFSLRLNIIHGPPYTQVPKTCQPPRKPFMHQPQQHVEPAPDLCLHWLLAVLFVPMAGFSLS